MKVIQVEPTTNFLYPLNRGSGYEFDVDVPISVENFYSYVVSQGVSQWGISSNFRNIVAGDRVWAYFGGKDRRICGVGSVHRSVHPAIGGGRPWIDIKWDHKLTATLRDHPIYYEEFGQWVPGAVARANRRTDRVLTQWLESHGRKSLLKAEKVRFAKQEASRRLGQGRFRDSVVRRYDSTCVVTKCTVLDVLEAAHIEPVASGGDHDVSNALLLRSDIHNLFDLGLLTISESGKIRVDYELRRSEYFAYHGKQVHIPKVARTKKLMRRLGVHQSNHSIL